MRRNPTQRARRKAEWQRRRDLTIRFYDNAAHQAQTLSGDITAGRVKQDEGGEWYRVGGGSLMPPFEKEQ